MSRKQGSFRQLIEYINQNNYDTNLMIHNNLYGTNEAEIIDEFEENASYLKKIVNGNYLYHEIISLNPESRVSVKKQIEIIKDIGYRYLQKRASNNLSYGRIHIEKKHIHLHLVISSNELYNEKRHRICKFKYRDIQIEMEEYKNRNFPEL
jgi:hypothetical protein